MSKTERIDFIGSFERAWNRYKSDFLKFIAFGAVLAIPSVCFKFSITAGVIVILLFGGFAAILLANAVTESAKGVKTGIFSSPALLLSCFKNGFMLSILLFPALVLGTVAAIIPAIAIFSVFMFSFFITAAKQKFAVDSLVESLRTGNGSRLPLFLFSLIFFASLTFAFVLFQIFMPLGFIAEALLFPYFFSVIYELYDQLEIKS